MLFQSKFDSKMASIITFMITSIVCLQGSNKCSTNCKSPSSPNDEICDAVTGHCLHGCNSGFVGAQCTMPCCQGCHECRLKNESSAEIVCSECGEGFFKRNGGCFQCSDNCLQGCNQGNGICNNGCKAGYYDPTCSQRCNELCVGRQCDARGSCVAGCMNFVLTGRNCSEFCSKGCKDRECNQKGECLTKGCNPGYWGIGCRKTCNTNCNVPSDSTLAVCDEMSGSCLHGCKDVSHWGSHCTDVCEMNCGLSSYKSQRICDEYTGTCLHGCNNASRVWGPKCTYPCEETCLTTQYSTQKVCSEEHGECLHGCKPNTLWGPKCDRHCGETCIHTVCHSDTGACALGCIDGHEGEKCDMKDFCWLTNLWAIVLFVALGLSLIMNIVLSICYFRVKSKDATFDYPMKS